MTLCIQAEFLVGDVLRCAREMIRLARKLDCMVEVEFNGISLHATPYGQTPADIAATYWTAITRKEVAPDGGVSE